MSSSSRRITPGSITDSSASTCGQRDGVALLDPATKKPVWTAPLDGIDIRKWLPGEDWDRASFAYRRPAEAHRAEGHATLPKDIKPGQYVVALAILDRQGGLSPSARFATGNYFRGGWHPMGFVGIGLPPADAGLTNVPFDSPAFDDSLRYTVPEKFRATKVPPLPPVKAVTPWTADPERELINPSRYWTLDGSNERLEKQILADGSNRDRVIRVTGDFGTGATLSYTLGNGAKLDAGRYRFAVRVRGTPGQTVDFELADRWRKVSREAQLPLTKDWKEHVIEFEMNAKFKDETTLRFRLPRDGQGTFDLSDPRLKKGE